MEATELSSVILKIVQEQTHYSAEVLVLDKDLEAEMGIDSLVFLNITTAIGEKFKIPGEQLRIRECNTLRKLITQVAAKTAEIPESPIPSPARIVGPEPVFCQSPPKSLLSQPSGQGEQPLPNVSPPTKPETGRQATAASPPCFTKQMIQGIVRESLGTQTVDLASDKTFLSQGFSPFQQQQVCKKMMEQLQLPATLRLETCDTVEKLEHYFQAALTARVVNLPEQQHPYEPPPVDNLEKKSMRDFVEWKDPDLFAKTRHFHAFFKTYQSRHLYWYGMPTETPCSNRAIIYDEVSGCHREFIIMASNNYLGLTNHPKVIEAAQKGYKTYGATNTGCRIIGGTTVVHKELERRLAELKNTPAAIVFPSGYSANLGTISALVRKNDVVITDKVNHMSILDGCRLAGGQTKIYQHNDMEDLERVLQKCQDGTDGKLIVTDGVFSMHGDICNLPMIAKLARQYGARVLVDDAHATGVIGRTGAGTAEHFDMVGQVDLELGTLSKTLAGVGGFVAGNEEVIEYLRYYANSYVFAATIPAGVAAGIIAAIDVLQQEPDRLQRLWKNIYYFKNSLLTAGFNLGNTQSAIIPLIVGDDYKTLRMGRAMRARGLFGQTVVFPGVASGEGRLRLSVMSEHSQQDLDTAIGILIECGKKEGIIS